jgi:hypothetical protein
MFWKWRFLKSLWPNRGVLNQQGGGEDISSFSGENAWGQKETFTKYRQSQE